MPISLASEPRARCGRWSSLLVFLAACGGRGGDLPVLEPVCPGENAWSPGTSAFEEGTEDWGLTGVEGVRVEAVDFDGDGWPDLHVHRGDAQAGDDFTAGGVRESWLLRNDQHGHFVDVTESSGFRQTRYGDGKTGRPGSVVAWGDVDGDGDLDAYTGVTNLAGELTDTSEIVLNNGDGTFSLGPESSELRRTQDESPAGAAFLDWDRDGVLDLFVSQNTDSSYLPLQDQLYQGTGDGGLSRATTRAGIVTIDWRDATTDDLNQGLGHSDAWSALACDVDGDGREDLMASSYGRAPNILWTQGDDGTFTNRGVESGYAYDDRMDWSDNESARCYCKLNPDAEDCEGVPPPAYTACDSAADILRWNHSTDREPYRLGGNNGTTVCADVDNDGDLDLLQTDIVHWDVGSSSDPSELLLNDGTGTFDRPGNDVTGLTREHDSIDWNDGDMTAAIFDFDNDGWPDVYIGSSDYPGTRGLLWHQDSPGHFETVPIEDGIDHLRSHGVAVADFDRDGDLDVVVGHSLARCYGDCYPTGNVRLFLNKMGGNFVQLRLRGSNGNTSAIGARVSVTADGVTQTHEVGGGHGHYGIEDDLVQHFGLGAACDADVVVRWPDATLETQAFHVVAGHRYRVVQGAPLAADDP